MVTVTKPLYAALLAALLAWPAVSIAQETEAETEAVEALDPGMVLATVNGVEITLGHIISVRAKLPPEYAQLPPELLFDGILDQLVQQTLLSQSFEDELSLQGRITLENETNAVRAGEAIAKLVAGSYTEDDLMEAYNDQYPEETDKLEYRASHILVETEEEAKDLLVKLEEGAEFAALAQEFSTGPSSTAGGDIGWFAEGDMVTEFFDAVVSIEPGEVAGPVQTQFGWHLVNLVDTRQVERPEFETVRPELENQKRQTILEDRIAELTEAGEVSKEDVSKLDAQMINRFDLLEN